jgi:hypothetical protein
MAAARHRKQYERMAAQPQMKFGRERLPVKVMKRRIDLSWGFYNEIRFPSA